MCIKKKIKIDTHNKNENIKYVKRILIKKYNLKVYKKQ